MNVTTKQAFYSKNYFFFSFLSDNEKSTNDKRN